VDAAQREAFDRILENHQLYCTVCDNNNQNCTVHNTAADLDVKHPARPYQPKPYEQDRTNPFYRDDPDQCILCGRCVEACQNVQVNETLTIDRTATHPRVLWDGGQAIAGSSCVSCASYEHPSEIMDEVASLTPLLAGLNYERLEGYRSLQWPVAKDGTDTPVLFMDKFPFEDGKAKFYPIEPCEEKSSEFDLHLNNGRLLEHFEQGSMTYRCEGIRLGGRMHRIISGPSRPETEVPGLAVYAACDMPALASRLTFLEMAVSFSSAAFSSSNVCSSRSATSSNPRSLAKSRAVP
jgi:predicted molibdopterin-dependent oxidoreductase YjgC